MSTNHEAAEVVRKILSLLPGVDCGGFGGCGKATCAECAEAIADTKQVDLCPAVNQETVDEIAAVLGVETVPVKEEVAFIACSGNAAGKTRFAGCKSCKEAVESGFQRGECKDGCVGVGSCMDVCKFDAMKLENGRVIIDKEKCTGCGICAEKCPKKIIL